MRLIFITNVASPMFQGVTLTAVDSYDEYWQHFSNVDKDEATHMYQFYKKQLQILAYNQGKVTSPL